MNSFDHQSGKFLSIDGAEIYYEVKGPENAPPLLFLHGGLGTMEDFNVVLPRLEGTFKIIGVDSRGHGRSTTGTGRLSYKRLQADIEHLIAHLRLENLSIVGFSDGGITASRLAATPSTTIRKLIAIGTPWELKPSDPNHAIYSKVTGETWRKKFPKTFETYQSLNPARDFDRLVRSVVDLWLDTGPDGYPQESISNILCETLVVRGDEDHLVSRENTLGFVQRVKSSILSNIAFAGHIAFEDQPEIFAASLNQFLKD